MKRGTKVSVIGAECFSGYVVAATADMLVIQVGACTTILRRDCASMYPLQWRCAGLPVQVLEQPDMEAFRKRLREVEQRARKL